MTSPVPFVAVVVLSVSALQAADWPQWQGPDRTRLSKETGLLKQWPAAGPPLQRDMRRCFNNAILPCLEFATGNLMWRDRSIGKGTVMFADGHLYIQSENNMVGLAEATPEGYREKGRFEIPDKGLPSWAHPVVSDGRLYVRNQDILLVFDIRDGATR
jgi:hypothetical protein